MEGQQIGSSVLHLFLDKWAPLAPLIHSEHIDMTDIALDTERTAVTRQTCASWACVSTDKYVFFT